MTRPLRYQDCTKTVNTGSGPYRLRTGQFFMQKQVVGSHTSGHWLSSFQAVKQRKTSSWHTSLGVLLGNALPWTSCTCSYPQSRRGLKQELCQFCSIFRLICQPSPCLLHHLQTEDENLSRRLNAIGHLLVKTLIARSLQGELSPAPSAASLEHSCSLVGMRSNMYMLGQACEARVMSAYGREKLSEGLYRKLSYFVLVLMRLAAKCYVLCAHIAATHSS